VPGTNPTDLPRRYYEYQGGEGIAAQWLSIINVQKPTWVELVTWNDFTESYMSPADPAQMPIKQYFYNVGPLLKSHAGYAELQKYYIEWFKTGTKPTPNQDALYYFYLTHPKSLSAPNDTQNIVQYGAADTIYVTTNLTSAATLKVTTGAVLKTFAVAAGVSHTRIPFNTGNQHFTLVRNGTTLIDLTGASIDAAIIAYNFTTTSGFGYGPVIEKSAPMAPVLKVQ
jgi:glucan endo-1,3-alpha-glucosidase